MQIEMVVIQLELQNQKYAIVYLMICELLEIMKALKKHGKESWPIEKIKSCMIKQEMLSVMLEIF